MSQPGFRQVEVGDIVVRLMAETVEMKLRVTKVDENLIWCHASGENLPEDMRGGPDQDNPANAWKFDRATGIEEDEDLGWGVQFGVTGSRLVSFTKKGA